MDKLIGAGYTDKDSIVSLSEEDLIVFGLSDLQAAKIC